MKAPTADTVATAEPEIAAKNIQTIMVTIPSPPVMCPIKHSKKLTKRFAIPPPLIRLPASIKKGMAKRGNESTPAMLFWAIISVGMDVKCSIVTSVTIPMAYPIGTLSMSSTIKSPNKNTASMIIPPAHYFWKRSEYTSCIPNAGLKRRMQQAALHIHKQEVPSSRKKGYFGISWTDRGRRPLSPEKY